jgi:hypothetical protein
MCLYSHEPFHICRRHFCMTYKIVLLHRSPYVGNPMLVLHNMGMKNMTLGDYCYGLDHGQSWTGRGNSFSVVISFIPFPIFTKILQDDPSGITLQSLSRWPGQTSGKRGRGISFFSLFFLRFIYLFYFKKEASAKAICTGDSKATWTRALPSRWLQR